MGGTPAHPPCKTKKFLFFNSTYSWLHDIVEHNLWSFCFVYLLLFFRFCIVFCISVYCLCVVFVPGFSGHQAVKVIEPKEIKLLANSRPLINSWKTPYLLNIWEIVLEQHREILVSWYLHIFVKFVRVICYRGYLLLLKRFFFHFVPPLQGRGYLYEVMYLYSDLF